MLAHRGLDRTAVAVSVNVWMLSAWLGSASEPAFRCHPINTQSTYAACAAIDVNRDGRLDIVSGGWWYEAPRWERRLVREVQMIGGRYDDYANLPLDVNADGRLDLISANYRSRSLYWVEHPAQTGQPWTKHVIDIPGPMETGRLVDVDQDGQLDVLPNGTTFAAWWELARPAQPGGMDAGQWVRHDLPAEAVAHASGFGDIDGDGRGDIVTPRGWLQAPIDRRRGVWTWHAQWDLDQDSSVPILVHDVDADGDSDLVWGRGHGTGVYWIEQVRGNGDTRQWVRHAIDTSWSQAHSLLLADLDGDGQVELVAGKRFLGHDGKDVGEWDPLVIYWYDFDPQRRVLRRGTICQGGMAGFGLDPKAVDLEGDGDIDILAADRSGLFWCENLRVSQPGAGLSPVAPPCPAPDPSSTIQDHRQLLLYPVCSDGSTRLEPVRWPAHWAIRRAAILAGMQAVMGQLPDSSHRVALDIRMLDETDRTRYQRRRISYAPESGDRVPAYLLIPHDITRRAPAMLCLHQTTSQGKDEPAGLSGPPSLHYAHELAERGYVCLVPDYPSFGDYAFDFGKSGNAYVSGTLKAVWNNMRAIDLLETLPQVDRDRIGCIGHSLGGHNALFTASFDQRLRAVVTSCGFTAFDRYYGGDLRGWTSPRYMPRIQQVYQNDPRRVPFDFHEVLAAIAPRALLVSAPLHDDNFDVNGVRDVADEVTKVYTLLEAQDKLKLVYPDAPHDFPDSARQAAYQWLDEQLKNE